MCEALNLPFPLTAASLHHVLVNNPLISPSVGPQAPAGQQVRLLLLPRDSLTG